MPAYQTGSVRTSTYLRYCVSSQMRDSKDFLLCPTLYPFKMVAVLGFSFRKYRVFTVVPRKSMHQLSTTNRTAKKRWFLERACTNYLLQTELLKNNHFVATWRSIFNVENVMVSTEIVTT